MTTIPRYVPTLEQQKVARVDQTVITKKIVCPKKTFNGITVWATQATFCSLSVGTYPEMAVIHGGLCMIDFYTFCTGNNPAILAMHFFTTHEGLLLALMV